MEAGKGEGTVQGLRVLIDIINLTFRKRLTPSNRHCSQGIVWKSVLPPLATSKIHSNFSKRMRTLLKIRVATVATWRIEGNSITTMGNMLQIRVASRGNMRGSVRFRWKSVLPYGQHASYLITRWSQRADFELKRFLSSWSSSWKKVHLNILIFKKGVFWISVLPPVATFRIYRVFDLKQAREGSYGAQVQMVSKSN